MLECSDFDDWTPWRPSGHLQCLEDNSYQASGDLLNKHGHTKREWLHFHLARKGPGDIREHSIGFPVRSPLPMVEPYNNGSGWLVALLTQHCQWAHHFCKHVYPTFYSAPEVKYEFYENIDATIRSIPKWEQLVVLGDFNARLGADNGSWPPCLSYFGTVKVNENGQRLLELCYYHDLCITNSFFSTKPQLKVSWRHSLSKQWHQLDIMIRCTCIKYVFLTLV